MKDENAGSIEIVSAPWVVPVDSPILQDGGLVLAGGRIQEVGQRIDLIEKFPDAPQRHFQTVLMPALVNAHMHLELSHIRNISAPLPEQQFTDWILSLLAQRTEMYDVARSEIVEAFSSVLDDQYDSGVVLVADIGNEYFPELHERSTKKWPVVLRMLEHLAPNEKACLATLEILDKLDSRISATAHAPYSTVPELLVAVKKRCNKFQQLFSVHTAESIGEIEFIRSASGCFRDFLEKRDSWDGKFFGKENMSFQGTINYFDHLGLLDEKTLLVHCVHVTEQELVIAKKRNSNICLCPGSNRFLKIGKAPVEQMVDVGILPALGTDSFASNREINIWREMKILAEEYPLLTEDKILAMATLGGARALNYDDDFGSLCSGKIAKFIHVSSQTLQECRTEKELKKELVSGGRPLDISWVDTVH